MKIDGSSVSRGDYIYYFGELGNWQRNKDGKLAKQIDLEQSRGEKGWNWKTQVEVEVGIWKFGEEGDGGWMAGK